MSKLRKKLRECLGHDPVHEVDDGQADLSSEVTGSQTFITMVGTPMARKSGSLRDKRRQRETSARTGATPKDLEVMRTICHDHCIQGGLERQGSSAWSPGR